MCGEKRVRERDASDRSGRPRAKEEDRIKPANIFLCLYGEDCDFVKVLDFGLVKGFAQSDASEPALTCERASRADDGAHRPVDSRAVGVALRS
jgi:hypothetical protein